jgi:D-lactate dehydrogenase
MKIAMYCHEGWERDYLAEHLRDHDVRFLSPENPEDMQYTDSETECVCVFIKTRVDSAMLERFPALRGVVTRSTGFDHIDLSAMRERGIVVSNVPAYGENTIAEYAFAMLLALSRKIYETYERVIEEGNFSTEGIMGFDLRGRKMGIVGTGHTGQYAIRIARGFGMEVIAFDVREHKELESELEFMYVTFDDLLAQSDVISLHAPYNEHTRHMIHSDAFAKMKRGVYLLNTARGGLIETRALVRAIEEGIVAGAGLDVVESEEKMAHDVSLLLDEHPDAETLQILLANQYLIDHPDVLIMPHNAFNTREARERILATTIENIHGIAHNTPINVVG